MPSPRLAAVAALALAALLAGCASLPAPEGRPESHALSDTGTTKLGRSVAPDVAAHPNLSGIHKLPVPTDAFAARWLLAHASERSLDVQYFLWHADAVGTLLFEALCDAARRGVRVRVLLDDYNTEGEDGLLADVGALPNLEVRLYNPFALRNARTMNLLSDFDRLNRRMHNKSFTADNQVAIVGGRNIADEYFGAAAGVGFADLDVIAVGPAVAEVSAEFDLYWNSASAYPAPGLVGAPAADAGARLQARFAATRSDPDAQAYLAAVRATPLVHAIAEGQLDFAWAKARLFYDDPAKTLDSAAPSDALLFPELLQAMGRPQRTLDMVSPYFVPGEAGTAALEALARSGVKIRILTNSLAATDESAVHAGYAKRRAPLLAAGVEIHELKPTATGEAHEREHRFGTSSSAALHAKTFAVDRERIFVGSFNFDPRSKLTNTEMGLVIDSPPLARELAAAFDTEVPHTAYTVRLTATGDLEWIEQTAQGEKTFTTEPETSWVLRGKVDFLSLLPIESLL